MRAESDVISERDIELFNIIVGNPANQPSAKNKRPTVLVSKHSTPSEVDQLVNEKLRARRKKLEHEEYEQKRQLQKEIEKEVEKELELEEQEQRARTRAKEREREREKEKQLEKERERLKPTHPIGKPPLYSNSAIVVPNILPAIKPMQLNPGPLDVIQTTTTVTETITSEKRKKKKRRSHHEKDERDERDERDEKEERDEKDEKREKDHSRSRESSRSKNSARSKNSVPSQTSKNSRDSQKYAKIDTIVLDKENPFGLTPIVPSDFDVGDIESLSKKVRKTPSPPLVQPIHSPKIESGLYDDHIPAPNASYDRPFEQRDSLGELDIPDVLYFEESKKNSSRGSRKSKESSIRSRHSHRSHSHSRSRSKSRESTHQPRKSSHSPVLQSVKNTKNMYSASNVSKQSVKQIPIHYGGTMYDHGYDFNDRNQPQDSFEQPKKNISLFQDRRSENDPGYILEKQQCLLDLQKLSNDGIYLTKNYSMADSLADMQYEYMLHKQNLDMYESVEQMKSFIGYGCKIIEAGNQMLGPVIKIDGWSAQIDKDMYKLTAPLEKIYKKYMRNGGEKNPFLQIALIVFGSLFMTAIQNHYLGGSGTGINLMTLLGGFMSGTGNAKPEDKKTRYTGFAPPPQHVGNVSVPPIHSVNSVPTQQGGSFTTPAHAPSQSQSQAPSPTPTQAPKMFGSIPLASSTASTASPATASTASPATASPATASPSNPSQPQVPLRPTMKAPSFNMNQFMVPPFKN